MEMTKREKIINMFRNEYGWKKGIRNGLTILQILDKLGIKPRSHAEWWDEKRRVSPIVWAVQKYLLKERIVLFNLPFSKKRTRIYFIPETEKELQRCLIVLEDKNNKIRKKYRYDLQRYRYCIRRELSEPGLSEKEKKEFQTLLDESYQMMDD